MDRVAGEERPATTLLYVGVEAHSAVDDSESRDVYRQLVEGAEVASARVERTRHKLARALIGRVVAARNPPQGRVAGE